ncbi:ABC transporter substrate-binding protein [Leucobacter muris]|uniref:ABC transporter substrate-binding protein n=1 Tax=Leucobacter muris TaxID=1935379 RepID=UPI00225E064B|nr:ABC transporter substrate-binding protein [Leucobacter muris]
MQITTPRFRKKLLLGAAAALAASLALVGCAGGDAQPSESPDVTLVDTGEEIDQVTVAFPGSLANLYIGQESGILNYNLAATVQEGLVGQDADGQIVPALAETWETPDELTYVFTLREDAKFQNGDPVTPADVIFSIERAQDAEASPGISFYLANIDSVQQTGDNEITISTQTPDATFLVNLSNAGPWSSRSRPSGSSTRAASARAVPCSWAPAPTG